MKKFKTVCSAIIMIIAAIMGLFVGALLNEAIGRCDFVCGYRRFFSGCIRKETTRKNKLYQIPQCHLFTPF